MATATLTQRIDVQIAALRAEKQRIRDQAVTDGAAVDTKIDALLAAKATLTPDVEASYVRLRQMGIFREF